MLPHIEHVVLSSCCWFIMETRGSPSDPISTLPLTITPTSCLSSTPPSSEESVQTVASPQGTGPPRGSDPPGDQTHLGRLRAARRDTSAARRAPDPTAPAFSSLKHTQLHCVDGPTARGRSVEPLQAICPWLPLGRQGPLADKVPVQEPPHV
ncbi:unnamed protein product [Gadus morhua 'NCC']